MRGISLWQPWASLIGVKRFETRSRNTSYRGPLAIQATLYFPVNHKILCLEEPFYSALRANGYDPSFLPLGCFVELADLVAVHRTEDIAITLSSQELAFGNYSPGRYAWQLENIRRIAPVPAVGARGLWRIDEDTWRQLEARVIK
jgi:hypothetical protein